MFPGKLMLPDWELDVWGEKDRFCVGVGLFMFELKKQILLLYIKGSFYNTIFKSQYLANL